MFRTLANDPDSAERLVQVLRTVADLTRVRLLGALERGERNVSSLCEELDLPQPTVSHHLGLLRKAEFVSNRRDGKQVFYAINPDVIELLRDCCGAVIRAQQIELRLEDTAAAHRTPRPATANSQAELKPDQPQVAAEDEIPIRRSVDSGRDGVDRPARPHTQIVRRHAAAR